MSSEQSAEESKKDYELPYVLKLEHPIQWGSEVKTEIVFSKRPKAKDFKTIKASDIRMVDIMKVIASITSEPISLVEEMDASDFMAAAEVVNSFLPAGPTTGAE